MNTRIRNPRSQRVARPTLAPITRAIRHSLFASAALVALSLPVAALAGNGCGQTPSLRHCVPARAQPDAMSERVDDPSVVSNLAAPVAAQAGLTSLLATDAEYGVVVLDPYSATLENSDPIVIGAYASGDASAYGAIAGSDGFSYLTNTDAGMIDVVADSLTGTALAVGAYAYAGASASLWNYGDVSAQASSGSGVAQAYAAVVAGGIGLLVNGGQLQADAHSDSGDAHATGALVVADVASIFNDTGIVVSATSGATGSATARGAAANARYAAVYNDGNVTVNAVGGLAASATGLEVRGLYGVTAYNAGMIEVDANSDGAAYAAGMSGIATVFGAYATNLGDITVAATGASAQASGIVNASLNVGDAITTNSGDIAVLATGGIAPYGEIEAVAQGIYNLAAIYGSSVHNDGSISATALALADISGTSGFLQAKAVGVQAITVYGYGDAVLVNAGDVAAVAKTSQGYASAWGAAVQTSGRYGGTASIDNDGTIGAYAYADIGVARTIGAYALDQYGDISVVNQGGISAGARAERGIVDVSVNYAYATGLKAASYSGTVNIDNYGSIAATASAEGAITGARGIQASGAHISITNAAGAYISATGEVDLFGGGFATGIEANGVYSIDIVNDGDIDVYGHAHAYSDDTHGYYGAARALGIYAAAGFQGNVAVTNNGNITANALAEDSVSWAQGGAGATGINAYAKYAATVVNNGDVLATAQTQFGNSSAYGVIGHGKYSTDVVNAAGASIVAQASTGSLASDTYGGRTVSFGVHVFGNGMDHGVIYNAGSIASHASATAESANPGPTIASAWGASIGAYSNVLSGTIINLGDIEATASADFGSATAYGSYILSATSAATSNVGTLFASAEAVNGNAWSVGSFSRAVEREYHVPCVVVDGPYGPYNQCDYSQAYWVVVGGASTLDNAGGIAAIARAAGGASDSYGAVMLGGLSASMVNTGQISALAEADDALAVGALANAFYGEATVVNSGDIGAVARGDIAEAKGVQVLGRDGTQVDNSGTIVAGAYGADATATAVAMASSGSNVLTNSGAIAAFGDGLRIAIDASAGGSALLSNSGSVIGAILTGGGDDSFDNADGGTWLALGASGFGGGDDSIVNHGSLVLRDASIALGGYVDGNAFDNAGTMTVAGASGIDMGGGFAFSNTGMIDFIDGAADDTLGVAGVLAGTGTLRFDADLGAQAGDRLQVTGDVAGSAIQGVDVNVFGVPVSAHEHIDLVTASGTLGGTFALGTVHASSDFFTEAFSLVHSAHAVSLDMDVTGLNAAGSVAATLASAAAGMLTTQVGTFRQRLGVNPYGDPGKVMSAFFRTYTGQGDVTPRHVAANFGQGGHFDYDLSTWGREIGVNANLFDKVHLGLFAGSADGLQRLAGPGVGSNRMDGATWGLYATWYAPQGFYVDLSGRWMAVDVRSTSPLGALQTRVHTQAWNIEAGYPWQLAGWSVVPQLQYTRTTVSGVDALQGAVSSVLGDGGNSARARVGVEISRPFETGSGLRVQPFASLNWVREFDGDMAYTVANNFHGVVSDQGSSVMAELGLGIQKGHWSLSLGGYWLDGGAYKRGGGAQAVVRLAW